MDGQNTIPVHLYESKFNENEFYNENTVVQNKLSKETCNKILNDSPTFDLQTNPFGGNILGESLQQPSIKTANINPEISSRTDLLQFKSNQEKELVGSDLVLCSSALEKNASTSKKENWSNMANNNITNLFTTRPLQNLATDLEYISRFESVTDFDDNGLVVNLNNNKSNNHCSTYGKERTLVESECCDASLFDKSCHNIEIFKPSELSDINNEAKIIEINVGSLIKNLVQNEFEKSNIGDQGQFLDENLPLKNSEAVISMLEAELPRTVNDKEKYFFESEDFEICNKSCQNTEFQDLNIFTGNDNETDLGEINSRQLVDLVVEKELSTFKIDQPHFECENLTLALSKDGTSTLGIGLPRQVSSLNLSNLTKINVPESCGFKKNCSYKNEFSRNAVSACSSSTGISSKLHEQHLDRFVIEDKFPSPVTIQDNNSLWFTGKEFKTRISDPSILLPQEQHLSSTLSFNEINSSKNIIRLKNCKKLTVNFVVNAEFEYQTCPTADIKDLNLFAIADLTKNSLSPQPLYIDTRENKNIFEEQILQQINESGIQLSPNFNQIDLHSKPTCYSSNNHNFDFKTSNKIENDCLTNQGQETSNNSLISIANTFINLNKNFTNVDCEKNKTKSSYSNFRSKSFTQSKDNVFSNSCEQNELFQFELSNSSSSFSSIKNSISEAEKVLDDDQINDGTFDDDEIDIERAIDESILKYENFTVDRGVLATPDISEKSTQTSDGFHQNSLSYKRRLDFEEESYRPFKMRSKDEGTCEDAPSSSSSDNPKKIAPSKSILFGSPCKKKLAPQNCNKKVVYLSNKNSNNESEMNQSNLYSLLKCFSPQRFQDELLDDMELGDNVDNISLFDTEEYIEIGSENRTTESIKIESSQRFHQVPGAEEDNTILDSLLKGEVIEELMAEVSELDWTFGDI